MPASTPPKAIAVEVVATQATEADAVSMVQLDLAAAKSAAGPAYVVKLKFKALPEATSQGWALYVGDLRIPKYWAWREGVYFKVFDPQFFADHQGEKLRFSQDGNKFTDTGLKLSAPSAADKKSARAKERLPLQDDVLK